MAIGLYEVKVGFLTLWFGKSNYMPEGDFRFVKAQDSDGNEVQISDELKQKGMEEIARGTMSCKYRHVFP